MPIGGVDTFGCDVDGVLIFARKATVLAGMGKREGANRWCRHIGV